MLTFSLSFVSILTLPRNERMLCAGLINRARGRDLIGRVALGRIDRHADVFEFVMTVGKRDVTRSFHQQVQAIVFGDALLVTFDNARDLLR